MSQTIQEATLDDYSLQLLQKLVEGYGYPRVRDALDHLAPLDHPGKAPGGLNRSRPSARYLMTLTPEEREPYLTAAVDAALPLYMADLAKPNGERELTADLENGEFFEYSEEVDDHA